MLHEIKIQKPYADAIMEGRKNFEVRKNDRGYNAGDRVQFTVVNAMGQRELHPLDDEIYIIKYIHSGLGLKEGYVIFGIEPQAESEDTK